MRKDLVCRNDIEKSEKSEQRTEVGEVVHALAERMLFGAEPRPQSGPPRIILALDCTTSMGEFIEERKITPQAASTMANALFAKAGPAGLQVQLTYFRGDDRSSNQPRQFQVDKWYTTRTRVER
jgi:hypothetical protein